MELHEIEQAVVNDVKPLFAMRTNKYTTDKNFYIPRDCVADHFHALIGNRYTLCCDCMNLSEDDENLQKELADYLVNKDKNDATVYMITIQDYTSIVVEEWGYVDEDRPAIALVFDTKDKAHQVMSLLFKLLYTVECP